MLVKAELPGTMPQSIRSSGDVLNFWLKVYTRHYRVADRTPEDTAIYALKLDHLPPNIL